MAIGLEAQCAPQACCPLFLKNHRCSVLQHRTIRLRRSVKCAALHGIQLEQIKSWFQNRFEERKRLISLDEGESVSVTEENEDGVQFDLDLAVVLAGFAFEAYNSPPENVGTRESDGYKCETTYLSEALIRELYQGQLNVKLEKASNLPGLDLWGTSDPYVWLRIGDCAKQSRTVWATKDPVWDETLVLNVSDPFEQSLEVAVWDANVLSVHRRLGNYEVGLKDLCDGKTHELSMQLEGMGGGGTIFLKASYKTFEEIEKEKKKWEVPFLSDLVKGGLGGVLASIFGTEGIKVQDYVGSTVGSLQFLNGAAQTAAAILKSEEEPPDDSSDESSSMNGGLSGLTDALKRYLGGFEVKGVQVPLINFKSDEQHTLEQSGWDFQARADTKYIEKGLAHPSDEASETSPQSSQSFAIMPLPEVKTTLLNISGHMEELLGSWLMVATPILRQQTERKNLEDTEEMQENLSALNESPLGTSEREQMREMFKRAETAMEAWTILASALGRTSFVKSEFEKICFLESKNTDTQLSVWRDCRGQRLVVAFRGTEQTKWRDLATDLMLVPTGFNPERIADGDLSDEILVHTGFLTAYDSVRHRLLSIIKASVRNRKVNDDSTLAKWHIYMTGHSLGGALATLLAMDLSQTQMFKRQEVDLSMYNFGSPRVGNKAFADHYNKVIKDSWRIVNHRDIIPTVPRLMGYCHVAHPIYLSSLEDNDLLDDVIGEATPVAIVGEFLKGEKQLINKLLQTEISMLRALRDGTALMQHMEDFYYISLLESVGSSKCIITDVCAAVSQRVSSKHKTKQLSA